MNYWKLLFGILGLASLSLILQEYGSAHLIKDFSLIGWSIIPLCLTFVPTLICYTFVWYFVGALPKNTRRNSKGGLKFWIELFRITVIAIAWNNLSPFVKFLGEPFRLVELKKLIPNQRQAMESVLLYNLTHSLGTLISFVIAAILIPFIFNVEREIAGLFWISAFGFVSVLSLLLFLPWLLHQGLKLLNLRRASIWMRWFIHRIKRFYLHNKLNLVIALFFSVAARFIEGLTFYYSFKILNASIGFGTAAFLDVGRALADNAFFFVPYQLGSREYAVGFLMEHVFLIGGHSFIGAALFYRLVEILWMIIGYLWWGLSKNVHRPKSA